MRATRGVQEEIRGYVEVTGFELKRGLKVLIHTDVAMDEVVVHCNDFGLEVWGWNVEDALGRLMYELLKKYYEYREKEKLSQEEECILGRLMQYL